MTAVDEAARAGIDLSLIEVSLSYTYDKRAEQHQAALELALELERAKEALGRDKDLLAAQQLRVIAEKQK